jgi:serine/threonine protein kinase
MIGTPLYFSPEICSQHPYAEPSDIWSVGCLLWEMIIGKAPYSGANIAALALKITKGNNLVWKDLQQLMSVRQVNRMIEQCLQLRVNRRPSAEHVGGTNTILIGKSFDRRLCGIMKNIDFVHNFDSGQE